MTRLLSLTSLGKCGRLLLLGLVLVGCQTGGNIYRPSSGLTGSYTRQVVISNDPHHVLLGHLVAVQQDDAHVRALVIHQRRDGVHRLRMTQVRMDGIALPFRSGTSGMSGCTHGTCRDYAVGMVFLSDALFSRLIETGLTARLLGREGVIDITVPSSLFTDLATLNPEAPAGRIDR